MTRAPKNIVASILARLRNVATEAGLSFNDILQAYVIERFLARLARSPHAETVLLKGALMLRVWGVSRAALATAGAAGAGGAAATALGGMSGAAGAPATGNGAQINQSSAPSSGP